MQIAEAVVLITGGASGIGRAMGHRFAASGAGAIVIVDRNIELAEETAESIRHRGTPARALVADVARAEQVDAAVGRALAEFGRIDLLCSNAGIVSGGGLDTPDEVWNTNWGVNVMGHVHVTRAVLPGMLERDRGHVLFTASAAGLLTILGNAPYALTKHAVVAFAEWVSITYGDQGIGVSCLCPQGVRTPMLLQDLTSTEARSASIDGVLEPDEVASIVEEALGEERFLVLPHPEVAGYYARRAADPEGWMQAMRKLQRRLRAAADGHPSV